MQKGWNFNYLRTDFEETNYVQIFFQIIALSSHTNIFILYYVTVCASQDWKHISHLAHLINLFYFAQLNSLECHHRLTKRLYHRGSRTCGWPIDRSPKKGPWPRAEVTPHPLHRSAFATTWAGPRAGCWPEQELKTFQIFIGSKRPENWTFVLAGNVRYFWEKNYFQS
jgi:hypothetical protein